MKGLNSANWIIEQIGAFARAAGEPFSAEELFMLKQPVGYFNESNRPYLKCCHIANITTILQ